MGMEIVGPRSARYKRVGKSLCVCVCEKERLRQRKKDFILALCCTICCAITVVCAVSGSVVCLQCVLCCTVVTNQASLLNIDGLFTHKR